MTDLIRATEGNWTRVVKGGSPVLVEFWAPWCSWCRKLAPIFERLAPEYAGRITFATVNVEEEPGLAERFGVQGIPALKVFCDGQVIDEFVGYLPEIALRNRIDEALSACALNAPLAV